MNKTNIILIIIIIVLVLVVAGTIFFANKNITDLTKKNDISIKEYDKMKKYYIQVIENADATNDKLKKELVKLEKQKKPEVITKIITKDNYIYLTDPEKEKYIFGLQEDKKNISEERDKYKNIANDYSSLVDSVLREFKNETKDTLVKVIQDLKKTNDTLKKTWRPSWGISFVESATLDTGLNFNATSNLIFRKYFDFKIVYFHVGGGGSFVYERTIMNSNNNYGGGLNFELGVNFK